LGYTYALQIFLLSSVSTMTSETQPSEGQDDTFSMLNVAIDALTLAKGVCGIAPAQAAFSASSALLTTIRVDSPNSMVPDLPLTYLQDSMANQQDYVELGLNCAEICTALGRGMNGKQLNDLNSSVRDAIGQLTRWVEQRYHSSDSSPTRFP
jgi:hypothetical protein